MQIVSVGTLISVRTVVRQEKPSYTLVKFLDKDENQWECLSRLEDSTVLEKLPRFQKFNFTLELREFKGNISLSLIKVEKYV